MAIGCFGVTPRASASNNHYFELGMEEGGEKLGFLGLLG
jgi:hypothetical protein